MKVLEMKRPSLWEMAFFKIRDVCSYSLINRVMNSSPYTFNLTK